MFGWLCVLLLWWVLKWYLIYILEVHLRCLGLCIQEKEVILHLLLLLLLQLSWRRCMLVVIQSLLTVVIIASQVSHFHSLNFLETVFTQILNGWYGHISNIGLTLSYKFLWLHQLACFNLMLLWLYQGLALWLLYWLIVLVCRWHKCKYWSYIATCVVLISCIWNHLLLAKLIILLVLIFRFYGTSEY